MTEHADHTQLEQVIAALTEGVILIEPDGVLAYANVAALAMHGAGSLDELGRSAEAYRRGFALHTRDGRPLDPAE